MALGSFFKERKEKNMKKIKKIIIGLILGLFLGLTLAIAPNKVKADNTITDLTGYTWTADSVITMPTTDITYTFNFTYFNHFASRYDDYLGLKVSNNELYWRYNDGDKISLKGTYGSVEGVERWYSTGYRVINITGGVDATNIELINWLSANGTLSLTTTNLTGFKWDANSRINFGTLYGGNNYKYDFNLNFYDSSDTNYIKMHFYSYTNNESINYYLNNTDNTKVYSSSSWDVASAKSIIITGGVDATNGMLINFMYLNGKITNTNSTMTAGDYRFNDVLSLGQNEFTGNISINFTSNNQTFTGMKLTADTLYYVVDSNNEIEVYNIGVNWLDSSYKRITVNTSQEVSTDFYNWFSSNSTKEVYYTITFDRNGATSGDLPPLQDVLSGTTFDLNNYNPGNLGKTDSTFLGWNTDASATTPLSSIVVNSDVLLYAIFSENPKSVNIKITCRDNVVWQGNAIFNNNKIVGGVSWDNPTMTNVFFESLDSQNVILINDKYGLNPNYTSNQLLLFFRPFSTEKDENGNYLAYINLIRLTTPKGTYAVNYTSDSSPKNINFDSWLASEGLNNMLKVDTDNYYFNLEISWSLEEPLPPGIAEWGNVATIMARIMASVTTLLNINIGFITIGNLLLIVIALSILFFVIKVWKGGN